jgi:hypothetical protein
MITWLLDMLRSVPEGNLPRKVFDTALRLEFPEDIADRQSTPPLTGAVMPSCSCMTIAPSD